MKTTRILASICLTTSCVALVTAANVSVGDQPGVVRMASARPDETTGSSAPVPPAQANGGPGVAAAGGGIPLMAGQPVPNGVYPTPGEFSPYFGQSFGATQGPPIVSRQDVDRPLFGPQLMFESNIDNGLGFSNAYHRLNARVPWHVVPGNTVLMGDLSASVTSDGDALYNLGAVWRNYDASRNRIFGWNVFGDFDQSATWGRDYNRVGFGVESLGKYVDARLNTYHVVGNESTLINDQLVGDLMLQGNNAFRIRNQTRENAYSGADLEFGGPLPVLGRRGMNMYLGGYYLNSDLGHDTLGFQARWEALITEAATVNVRFTNDDTFGTNSWVSLAYTIPNYFGKRLLQPKDVRERLADPVYRSNRVHTNIDVVNVPEAAINPITGQPYFITYVDPNVSTMGTGTLEDPYMTLQQAADFNTAATDVIRVTPRDDDTGAKLTVTGGLSLFDNQTLLAANKSFTLFQENGIDFVIPADPNPSGLGPLISDPNMVAGGSVVRVGNNNQIIGMRIDAANAAGTVFGTGVSNPLPFEDINLFCNTFTRYTTAVDLQDASGTITVDQNEFTGLTGFDPLGNSVAGVSTNGLLLTTATGSVTDLLIRNNTATNNSVAGISVTAGVNSTINADNPNAFTAVAGSSISATGVIGNNTNFNGDGMVITGLAGSTINGVVEDNVAVGNTGNGFIARADGGTWNLFSLRNNHYGDEDLNGNVVLDGTEDLNGNGIVDGNGANGAFLHYLNGGSIFAVSEDINEDINLNGILDAGEDLDGDGLLDIANGSLSAGEDLNGNGMLDQGIVSNTFQGNGIAGLCIFGEGDGTGLFQIGGPTAALGNLMQRNDGAGLAVDLQDSATASIDSMFNRIQNNGNLGSLESLVQASFIMSGDTLTAPGTLTNLSPTADIVGFTWNLDLPPGTQDWEFDTDTSATSTLGTPFTAVAGSELITGLQTVNGLNVAGGIGANVQTALDQSQLLTLGFVNDGTGQTGFDQNEQFIWQLDSDPTEPFEDTAPDNQVIASQLAGTTATLTVSDDFDGSGVRSQQTLNGTFVPSSTDPTGVQLVFDRTFRSGQFDQSATVVGNGIQVNAADDSTLTRFSSINDSVILNKGTGVNVVAQNNARIQDLTIQGAEIADNNGRGLNIESRNNAVVDTLIGGFDAETSGRNLIANSSYTQRNIIRSNGSDGVRVYAADGGTVNGGLINNLIEDNNGDGVTFAIERGGVIDFSPPPADQIVSRNVIRSNTGAGVRLVSNATATSESRMEVEFRRNSIQNNQGGGIVSELNGPNNAPPNPSPMPQNNVMTVVIDGTGDDTNFINNNSDVAIAQRVSGNGKADITIRNVDITGTTDGPNPNFNGDAINLKRFDSSLLTATIENVTATGNAGDGLDVDVQGEDKNDPNQPMSGTVNSVTWNNNNFSNNGQNGARFRVRGDAQLVADGQGNVVNNNAQNGILVQTSENASFGDPTDGLPPGRRTQFDGTTASGNAVDGIQIVATEDSRALVEITSNRVAGTSGAHAAINTNGDTTISNNGRDGVHIETTGGRSDILITSGTGQTTISGNGTNSGGNGIRWDADGASSGTVRVTRTIIANNIAGASEDTNGDGVVNEDLDGDGQLDIGEDTNGNGVLDIAEDTNNNADIDVADGDGIQFNVNSGVVIGGVRVPGGVPTPTLVVGGIGDGNFIQGNQDDGIAITTTGSNFLGVPRPIISIVDNTIGGEDNGIAAGNGGDGVSLNIFGGTADVSQIGSDPANIDSSIPPADGDGLSPNNGVTESGPIVQLAMSGNLISNNNRKGVNLLLTGAAGERDRENGAAFFDPVRLTLTDNTIISNGEEGIFFRGDSQMNQGRLTYLANFPFPDPPFNPANDRPKTFSFYTPTQPEFLSRNAGSVNGNTAFSPTAPDGALGYLNLRTVQNTLLTIRDNTIENNGTNTVTGEGVYIRVGTGAYVAADIQDNNMGGNLEEDFKTDSFLSFGNTFDSIDNSGDGTFDVIYWDDSAQFDLRFQNNNGNQIDPSAFGAVYNNFDALKAIALGNIGVLDRDAGFFQVDNGNNLDNPNNTFINFGQTQDIDGAFSSGGYNLRSIADPAWPNIGFAPFLP